MNRHLQTARSVGVEACQPESSSMSNCIKSPVSMRLCTHHWQHVEPTQCPALVERLSSWVFDLGHDQRNSVKHTLRQLRPALIQKDTLTFAAPLPLPHSCCLTLTAPLPLHHSTSHTIRHMCSHTPSGYAASSIIHSITQTRTQSVTHSPRCLPFLVLVAVAVLSVVPVPAIIQPVKVSHSHSRSASRSLRHSLIQPLNQSVSRSLSTQPVTQSASHSVTQPVTHSVLVVAAAPVRLSLRVVAAPPKHPT